MPTAISALCPQPGVNFINILHAHFAPIFLHQKMSNPKHSFVIFCAKISYQKSACIILMKLMAAGSTRTLTLPGAHLSQALSQIPFSINCQIFFEELPKIWQTQSRNCLSVPASVIFFIQSNSVIANSSGPTKFFRYNRGLL